MTRHREPVETVHLPYPIVMCLPLTWPIPEFFSTCPLPQEYCTTLIAVCTIIYNWVYTDATAISLTLQMSNSFLKSASLIRLSVTNWRLGFLPSLAKGLLAESSRKPQMVWTTNFITPFPNKCYQYINKEYKYKYWPPWIHWWLSMSQRSNMKRERTAGKLAKKSRSGFERKRSRRRMDGRSWEWERERDRQTWSTIQWRLNGSAKCSRYLVTLS